MSYSRNECEFVGNLTRDPELRHVSTGNSLADIGVAVDDLWKDKDGNWNNRAIFLNCSAWGNLAEKIVDNYRKGDQIHFTSKFKLDEWDDKTTGEKRKAPKFNITNVWFPRKPKDGGSSQYETSSVDTEEDDDIPF